MAFRDYLAAFLLGASAFFFPLSHEAKAEDKEISVEFRYSGVEKLKNPGSDLEGKLKASAWREGTKLCLQIDAENCQLHSSTEYLIGLPIEVDITSITQKARVNARTKDGRGYEEQWITLFDNKGLERGGKILLGPVIGVFEVPFVTDVLMDEVENEKETRTRERTRKMKNEKLILIQIPRQYPDRPLAYPTNLSRLIEITLDKEPGTTPQFLFRAWAQDKHDRIVTADDVYLKCDKGTRPSQAQKSNPQFAIPKRLERWLINRPGYTLKASYSTERIIELSKIQIPESYFMCYEYPVKSRFKDGCSLITYILFTKSGSNKTIKQMTQAEIQEMHSLREKCKSSMSALHKHLIESKTIPEFDACHLEVRKLEDILINLAFGVEENSLKDYQTGRMKEPSQTIKDGINNEFTNLLFAGDELGTTIGEMIYSSGYPWTPGNDLRWVPKGHPDYQEQ